MFQGERDFDGGQRARSEGAGRQARGVASLGGRDAGVVPARACVAVGSANHPRGAVRARRRRRPWPSRTAMERRCERRVLRTELCRRHRRFRRMDSLRRAIYFVHRRRAQCLVAQVPAPCGERRRGRPFGGGGGNAFGRPGLHARIQRPRRASVGIPRGQSGAHGSAAGVCGKHLCGDPGPSGRPCAEPSERRRARHADHCAATDALHADGLRRQRSRHAAVHD